MAHLTASVLRARLWSKARIRHLQVLVRVAELGSIHKAAADIGMTQPAVTQQLAELERLLETPLFLRHRKGAKLTALGEQLLPVARQVLRNMDALADDTAALRAEATGVVRVVASQGGVAAVLAHALPRFNAQVPEVVVQIQESDPSTLSAVLASGKADLAVMRLPAVVPEGWRFTPLVEDRLVVVAGAQHPLARRTRKAPLGLLRQQQWLALPVDSAAREAFDQLFAESGPPDIARVNTRSPGMLWAMLTRLDILAITPASLVRQFTDGGIMVEVPTELKLPLEPIGLLEPVTPRGAAAARLAAFVSEAFRPRRR